MNRHASFNRRPLSLAIIAALAASGFSAPVQAITRTWDGGGANDNWSFMQALSFNTNWVGALSLPGNGDTLVFAGSNRMTPNNDYTNLSINGLIFAETAGAFVLGGNAITSTGNIGNNSQYLQTIDLPIRLGNDQTWDGGAAGLTMNGSLTLGNNALAVQNLTTLNLGNTDLDVDNASLTLNSGSQLNNDITLIGSTGTGNSSISVNGAGSRWTSSVMIVGLSGKATMNIENGGRVDSSNGYLGDFSGSSGNASVSGANSQWNNSGDFYVGNYATGALTIEQGGQVNNRVGYLGYYSGSSGEVTVTGTDSQWLNSSDLFIGFIGDGALAIEQGGHVSNVNGYLGYFFGSTGQATVSGTNSQWSNDGDLYVGFTGTGTLTIDKGGQVNNANAYLGTATGTGSVTVTGADSLWSNRDALHVGYFGSGTLLIEQGGRVENTDAYLGRKNSIGNAIVTGANSQWTNMGDLYVGREGHGTLAIANGGTVDVGGDLSIGAYGMLDLNDGVITAGSAAVVQGGVFNWRAGTVNLASAIIGDGGLFGDSLQLNASRVLNVSGNAIVMEGAFANVSGTHFTVGGDLANNGMMRVNADAYLTVGNQFSNTGSIINRGMLKAETLDNSGNLQLAGTGLVVANHFNLQGGSVTGAALNMDTVNTLSGHGTVASAITGGTAGNTIQASGGLSLGDINSASGFDFGGHLNVGSHRVVLLDQNQAQLGVSTTLANGGQLEAGKGIHLGTGETLSYTGNASILGDFSHNGEVSGSGGALTFLSDVNGAGSFSGDIVFHAGYNPGNSPAAVDFNGGNATYDATSVLTMEILGSTPGSQYDQLVNIDHLSFNGILNLVFGPNFTPSTGQWFDLFDFNSFSGSLAADRITVTGLDRSLLDFSALASYGRLQIAAVPLPAGVWLFVSGLAALVAGSRRRE